MQQHKFDVGQSVRASGSTIPSFYGRSMVAIPAGEYAVVRQMPAIQAGPQYRVRSNADGHERVVLENDLSA